MGAIRAKFTPIPEAKTERFFFFLRKEWIKRPSPINTLITFYFSTKTTIVVTIVFVIGKIHTTH
jgi:hypothetical protein